MTNKLVLIMGRFDDDFNMAWSSSDEWDSYDSAIWGAKWMSDRIIQYTKSVQSLGESVSVNEIRELVKELNICSREGGK
jgi:hypothetical protein